MSWVVTGTQKEPAGDPFFFSNVSLLLHGDGTNGSTVIRDSSSRMNTVTAVGDAQISTAQSKFGGASIAFDGTGDLLRVASNPELQLGTGDFTLELWAYLTARSDFGSVFDFRTANMTQVNVLLTFLGTTGGGTNATLKLFVNGSVRILGPDIPLNQWVHIALCRGSGNTRLFLDGVQGGPTYVDTNNYVSSLLRVYGNILEANFLPGYADEVRITKGVARYTADFTPPAAPFPDI